MAQEFSKKFYRSREWRQCREAYIQSVHGLCEKCLEKGIVKPGHIVHHTIRLTPENINNPEITLNHEHLRYDCLDCHNREYSEDVVREGLMFDEFGDLVEIIGKENEYENNC